MSESVDTSRAKPFRRRDASAIRQRQVGPAMTPMVDVVMVILIFFMASTAFLGPEWFLSPALPPEAAASTGRSSVLPDARLVIELRREADQTRATGLGLDSGTLEELDRAITTAGVSFAGDETILVLIEPTEDVPYADVVRVHAACLAAGLERIALP